MGFALEQSDVQTPAPLLPGWWPRVNRFSSLGLCFLIYKVTPNVSAWPTVNSSFHGDRYRVTSPLS